MLDINLVQGQEGTMDGIPLFGVEITNVCTGGCPISDVHVACGDFASATLVNPAVFRRLSLNDCLVNNGKPISNGDMIRFEYDNSFMYSMHVRSAVTCHWTSWVQLYYCLSENSWRSGFPKGFLGNFLQTCPIVDFFTWNQFEYPDLLYKSPTHLQIRSSRQLLKNSTNLYAWYNFGCNK